MAAWPAPSRLVPVAVSVPVPAGSWGGDSADRAVPLPSWERIAEGKRRLMEMAAMRREALR
jgi:hypothetical protein